MTSARGRAVVLVTGMSGSGKSTVGRHLGLRGHRVVDTELPRWSTEVTHPDGSVDHVWDDDAIDQVISDHHEGLLVLTGCSESQGRFRHRFDAVVLLTAPLEVLLQRVRDRTDNPYGRTPEHRALVAQHVATVEPLLRQSATAVVDTTGPVDATVDEVERIALIQAAEETA